MPAIPTLMLNDGERVPVLGQGTWGMGEDRRNRAAEVNALQLGIDLGMTLIDTAEMYADGGAEVVVGEAIRARHNEVFIVSKVLPNHASRRGTVASCEASLKRLGRDYIDLYLLHWRGHHPFEETLYAFQQLQEDGKIIRWGVSNLDVDETREFLDLPGGEEMAANQVLYNLTRRGIEHDLMPFCRGEGIPVMAYSPIEQGRLLSRRELRLVAERHGVTPAMVALAWVMRQDGVLAIPKATNEAHVRENRAAADLQLTQEDLADLDRAFPPPDGPQPLEML